MEQKRPKGRGLEEVAHLFFSSQGASASEKSIFIEPSGAQGADLTQTSAEVVGLVSLVDEVPVPFLAANLAIELAKLQRRVLMAETSSKTFNTFFALGLQQSYIPIERFLAGETLEVVVCGPSGVRILAFPLNPGRVSLLRSVKSGGLFRRLLREEISNDVLLLNLDLSWVPQCADGEPGQDSWYSKEGSLRIASEALEILMLIPSDLRGLRTGYRLIKSLFRQNPRSRIGVLLYHQDPEQANGDRFSILAEAAAKFLSKKLYDHGHLTRDRHLSLSVIHGRPLSMWSEARQNTVVLAKLACQISEQVSQQARLSSLLRSVEKRLLMEALCAWPRNPGGGLGFAPLSGEEIAFFERGLLFRPPSR